MYARHSRREEIDPISLNGIDMCNGWLTGEMDNEEGILSLKVRHLIHDASGAGEPEVRTTSTMGKRKEPSTDVSHVACARAKNSRKAHPHQFHERFESLELSR